eukprot:7526459-Pyramimonas_sp.AAC.1
MLLSAPRVSPLFHSVMVHKCFTPFGFGDGPVGGALWLRCGLAKNEIGIDARHCELARLRSMIL